MLQLTVVHHHHQAHIPALVTLLDLVCLYLLYSISTTTGSSRRTELDPSYDDHHSIVKGRSMSNEAGEAAGAAPRWETVFASGVVVLVLVSAAEGCWSGGRA